MSRNNAQPVPLLPPPARVDVRTNMLMLLLVNTLVLTGRGGAFQLAAIAVVTGLLLLSQRGWAAVALSGGMAGLAFVSEWLAHAGAGIALAAILYARPYIIAGFMGYYFISVTTPAMLIAGMYRLRFPRAIVIPLAVMVRFFPVLREEQRAIRNGMRLRGLPGPGGWALHPWRTLVYLLIPLTGALLRTGEALSASALSRGLGAIPRPTTIQPLRPGLVDALLVVVCLGLVMLFIRGGR
ncbi:energy-coupling factor transporter transmembrane protein EcfT [Shimwellia pseudoproteus]|uniref:energy-coupling factor transporter transmembrane component T n=1 Tax=Shimwellia pseudoproteus TaxID=570012 RepID=UPI0018EA8F34|nr:energy-coupling factor transporter transmembrane component T [Shimwellia pseudoproteus]MBJ3813671.1 energy-coupling factor transporter transmembrane protein EcfT [Shimwellia pseudoproteus]